MLFCRDTKIMLCRGREKVLSSAAVFYLSIEIASMIVFS